MNHYLKQDKSRAPSLVPPVFAAIISLIIPGLGNILARDAKRGLFFMGSFLTSAGLLVWRVADEGKRYTDLETIIKKAFWLDPILLVLAILLLAAYIWIAYSAYAFAAQRTSGTTGLIALMTIIYFLFGWQIGQINIYDLITKMGDSKKIMEKIAWPWDAAIHRPEEWLIGEMNIQIPCTEDEYFPPAADEGTAYVVAAPTCGSLAEEQGVPGSPLHLEGHNFLPDTPVEIYWQDPVGNEFRQRQEGAYVILDADANGFFEIDIVMPYRLLPLGAMDGSEQIWQVQGRQLASLGEPVASEIFKLAIDKMIETIFLGMMATFFGIILALPISFLAARNLMSASPITLAIYFFVRTILNIVRSIEPMIWAVIAVIIVGLGPFAGIVALTFHTIAALGKLYSEAIESIDPGPIEAIHATGANWLQTIIYAVVPQIIPPFVSFTIYRWDINVRMSTVIGLVGGGGIGFLLMQWIRLFDYRAAGIAVWFITITVATLDFVSSEIRRRFV